MPAPRIAVLLLATLAAPPATAPPPLKVDARDVPRLLSRLAAADPPVEEVQRAAARLATGGLEESPGWPSRARWAALVPQLAASYTHAERSSRTLSLTSSAEVDLLRLTPTDEVGVRLSWNLPELVFAEGELKAADAAARAARRRAQAVERATQLYFKRRELIAELWLAPPDDARQRLSLELAAETVTAELDYLTGGLFGGRR